METKFYGNNLCNLLCNRIIEEYNIIEPNHNTEITLVDLNQFLVLKGRTNIQSPPNYSILLNQYYNNLNLGDRTFNVIDLIEYNSKVKNDYIYLNLDIKRDLDSEDYFNLTNQGFFEIDYSNNIIKHNNINLYEELILIPEYKDYKSLKVTDYSIYSSDPFFGKNLISDKIYETFLRYVSFNLFERNLCKDINIVFSYSGDINELSWETLKLSVSSESFITSDKWIHSLILDIFDFNIKEIKKHLSLSDYNFENEIISLDRCWKKRDKVSEIFLL